MFFFFEKKIDWNLLKYCFSLVPSSICLFLFFNFKFNTKLIQRLDVEFTRISYFRSTTKPKNVTEINLAVDFSSFNFNSFIVYFRISWIVYVQCSSHFQMLLAFVCGFHRYFIFSLWLYRNLFRAFCKWFILLCDSPSLTAFENRLRKRQREGERYCNDSVKRKRQKERLCFCLCESRIQFTTSKTKCISVNHINAATVCKCVRDR